MALFMRGMLAVRRRDIAPTWAEMFDGFFFLHHDARSENSQP